MKKLTSLIPDVINQPKTLAEVDGGVHVVLAEAIADYRSSQRGIEADEVERRIEAGKAAVVELVAQCESPIEKLIVPALVFQPYGSNGTWMPAQAQRDGRPRLVDVMIGAQVKVDRSRFDFLMVVPIGGADLMIAVECDGKDFHDETNDFRRDQMWKAHGIHTVRLSGSDIDRAPRMAASRVAEFVLQQMIRKGLA